MAFVVFEGVDGSGKSTLLHLLAKKLKEYGIAFATSREPGGTKIGEQIRQLLLDNKNTELSFITETLLYCADRAQHIKELIAPQLKTKAWLLSDRYWASTFAYQCGGRALDEVFIKGLTQNLCENYQPDLWVLLDLPVEISLKRLLLAKKDTQDRLEKETRSFHQRVRDYYLKLAKKNPKQWLVLDAVKPESELLEQLITHLKSKDFINE